MYYSTVPSLSLNFYILLGGKLCAYGTPSLVWNVDIYQLFLSTVFPKCMCSYNKIPVPHTCLSTYRVQPMLMNWLRRVSWLNSYLDGYQKTKQDKNPKQNKMGFIYTIQRRRKMCCLFWVISRKDRCFSYWAMWEQNSRNG